MKRRDFQELANIRVREARILLRAGCWEGAYYLSGYAVECALMACIARRTERFEFPDKDRVNQSYTHDLRTLVDLAGLRKRFEEARRQDQDLAFTWPIVQQWTERSRYERHSQAEAGDLLNAVQKRKSGVLQWLKRHY